MGGGGGVAKKTGFIVFKDRSIVSFYTNNLACTSQNRIHKMNEHVVYGVHDQEPLQRWTGDDAVRRKTLQVPPLIVAYTIFMNRVERFYQIRSTFYYGKKREESHHERT